ELFRTISVVRSGMVRIGDADFRVRPRARFARELKRDHTSDVALERQHLQVKQQLYVIAVGGRYSERAVEVRQGILRGMLLRLLDTPLDFAHRVEILAHFPAIACAQILLQTGDISPYPVENARDLAQPGATVRRTAYPAEQPVENHALMSFVRQQYGR